MLPIMYQVLDGITGAVFTISLSLKNTRTVNVSYATADNTATGDSDYITIAGTTISFVPLEISKQITAQIKGDFFDEENESFFVNLSNAVNATIDDSQGVCNIEDNDTAGFIATEKIGKSVSESGTTDTFSVALTAEPASNVVIDISSADAGEAIISHSSLTFTPANWSTEQIVTITGVDDTSIDGNQTTAINLSVNDGESDDHFDSVGDQSEPCNKKREKWEWRGDI